MTQNLFCHMQQFETPRSHIRSIGVYLPEKIVNNEELMSTLQTTASLKTRLPQLLKRITGINTRHYAPDGTSPSDLALAACLNALQNASLSTSDIDTLIFASTDSDLFEPATANILQKKIGNLSCQFFRY